METFNIHTPYCATIKCKCKFLYKCIVSENSPGVIYQEFAEKDFVAIHLTAHNNILIIFLFSSVFV